MIKGLRALGIHEDQLSVSIGIYEDLDREACLSFWSSITGVLASQFISVNVLNGKKKGKLPYGMCRVRMKKGGDMLKYMVALRKRVAEFF